MHGSSSAISDAARTRRPLRILYHHRTVAADGMRVHIFELVRALRASGHEVLVVGPAGATPSQAGQPDRAEERLDRLRRRLPKAVLDALELLYNLYAYQRLARNARAFRPDIIYERHNLFLLAGFCLSRLKGLPLILEVNAPLASERKAQNGLKLRSIGDWCEKLLWRHADVVLPVTRVLARHIEATCGLRRDLIVIPNGAQLEMATDEQTTTCIRQRYGLQPDDLVIGFCGFVRAWHGVGWAIEALRELPPHTHLLIVGDGPARPMLEECAAANGVANRVHFTGRLPHGEVATHIGIFDVALQTAAVAYASPLKLFEYMVLSRAIVAPDQPNVREVLTNTVDALLFTPSDAVSFRNAVIKLCTDPALRRRLGDAARQTVKDRGLTWECNASRVASLAYRLIDPAHS